MQKELIFENKIEQIPRLEAFVEELSSELNLSFAFATSLNLALEEAVVNVIEYAYPKTEENDFSLSVMTVDESGELRFVLKDHGVPFNPLAVEEPDITLSAESRPVGGLGIMLVRKIMDSVEYKYESKENILIMTKKIN